MENCIEISLKDMYQMLISECRYGYGRNNHLMPGDAYEKVKRYIPEMYKVSKESALNTIKQLCEECITEQLSMNFYDGEDDEFGNRKDALEFIKWALDWINEHSESEVKWYPYCYDRYLENLTKDDEPRYNVYEIINEDKRILLTEHPVSQNKYLDIIFDNFSDSGTYTKDTIKVDPAKFIDRRRHYKYHILTPEQRDFYVEHI